MIGLLFLVICLQPSLEEWYEVVSIKKRVSLEAEETHFLNAPSMTLHHNNVLFLVDNKELEIWKYNYKKDHFFYFSGKGEGPGELRKNILGFYVSGENLTVINANGTRQDIFSMSDGELQISRQTNGNVLYQEQDTRVYQKSGKYVLQIGQSIKAEVQGLAPSNYGPEVHTSLFKQKYFLIASTMSNNNTISYIIFDLENGTAQPIRVIEKRQKIIEENLPPRMKKGLNGMDLGQIFFNNFQVLMTQDELGFLIHEYGMGIFQSEERGFYSVLHAINPETDFSRNTITLYHRDMQHVSFVIPRKDENWIAFDAGRNEIVFLNVQKFNEPNHPSRTPQ